MDLICERIRNVKESIVVDLENVARNKDVSLNRLIKRELIKIISEYPDVLKSKSKNNKTRSELSIRGIGQKTKDEIQNIANNIGMSKTAFLKTILFNISESFTKDEKREAWIDRD